MAGGAVEVVSTELGDAAGRIEDAVTPFAGWVLPAAATGSFGHEGLAAAYVRMGEGATGAVAAGVATSRQHAASLRASAALYDLQDAAAAGGLAGFLGTLVGGDG
jgi:hypothetical protein